nr:TadE/TadG family type IV pilus assembly protein [Sphingobium nicotianae]
MARNRAGASFLTRLARDIRGNTIAIAAAAMVPLAGLIGGGVDMSRLYLTKTRLQQACDAGALAGRKAMGSGSWTTTGTGNSQSRADELFAANFKTNAYGTGTLSSNYTESAGTVTGTATVAVPMTIMRVFGMTQRSLTVTCTAKMEIPNTDVMFVLDNTGSMNCAPGSNCYASSPQTGAKITGLKSAVKCFYEALVKVNTPEVCGSDPTATSYTGTAQIRIGFVPYSVNVNLGKLLPNDFLANSRDFQTRVANTTPVHTWTVGAESALGSWSGWTPSSTPSSYNASNDFAGFATPGSDQTINGHTYLRKRTDKTTSSGCTGLNNLANSGSTLNAIEDVGGTITATLSSSSTPTWRSTAPGPDTDQTLTYSGTDPRTVYGLRYTWKSSACYLEIGTAITGYSRTNGTATSTKPITWTDYEKWVSWTYKQAPLDVSGLKAGGSSWNGSIQIPTGWATSPSYNVSGSKTPTNFTIVANQTATWGGCIEERMPTFQNSDYNPSDEWSPIPSTAKDMDIDLMPDPSDPTTQWGPVLPDAVWGRYTGSGWGASNSYDPVTTTDDLDHNITTTCPAQAKKLQTWYTSSGFVTYVNSLVATGNTYHDIGMMWGARFISPTGIFASENAATPTGGAIQRHIIFMTDGDTNTAVDNYSSQGIPWWDRRQTTYAPSGGNTDDILDARLDALCTAIKNKNITLWVVSYGGGTSSATETRLSNCASPGKYFSAASTATLIANFKQIASEIAELRLTS